MAMPQQRGGQSISKQQMVCWASYGLSEHTAESVRPRSQCGCTADEKRRQVIEMFGLYESTVPLTWKNNCRRHKNIRKKNKGKFVKVLAALDGSSANYRD